MEGIIATVRAAEAKKSPAMILLFPWAMQYANNLLVNLAADACRSASVPVTLHMDHAQDPAVIRAAADTGKFDSIMVDMSHYEKEENLAKTRELVKYCEERGIATEAEPGRIEGGEDGVMDTADLEGMLTSPEEAQEFVDTGITWLAPAFGNVHGNYGPRGIRLEYDRLAAVEKAVGSQVQLVLHGTDDYTEEHFHCCMSYGIRKININKAMNREMVQVQKEKAGNAPVSQVIEESTLRMQKAIEKFMDIFNSTEKA
jgi:fructose-bisphosphate aldolase class II